MDARFAEKADRRLLGMAGDGGAEIDGCFVTFRGSEEFAEDALAVMDRTGTERGWIDALKRQLGALATALRV